MDEILCRLTNFLIRILNRCVAVNGHDWVRIRTGQFTDPIDTWKCIYCKKEREFDNNCPPINYKGF